VKYDLQWSPTLSVLSDVKHRKEQYAHQFAYIVTLYYLGIFHILEE